MRMLLDTCVISETAKKSGLKHIRDRVARLSAKDTFLSVITIGEITKGVKQLDPSRKRTALEGFLAQLEENFEHRILDVGIETAQIWGEITAQARMRGKVIPPLDGIIAATAIQHGLHVMTRNVKDFEESGVLLVNPWEDD
ncbi:MAG: type II toxin-antitoxin system VapC family toxin [Planctomycetota bacterium]